MKIAYRVQHSLGRDQPLARLLERLAPLAVEVVTDHEVADPNPLRNYLRCLADPPAEATHLCVIQDDAVPCEGCASQVAEAVGERPDEVISLFVGGLTGSTRERFYKAMKRRERWCAIYMPGIVHVVALVWPVADAAEFVDWFSPEMPIPGLKKPHLSDDAVIGHWARVTKRQVWATVPCLVEHPDDVPSVAQSHRGGDGLDAGRRAIWFEE